MFFLPNLDCTKVCVELESARIRGRQREAARAKVPKGAGMRLQVFQGYVGCVVRKPQS